MGADTGVEIPSSPTSQTSKEVTRTPAPLLKTENLNETKSPMEAILPSGTKLSVKTETTPEITKLDSVRQELQNPTKDILDLTQDEEFFSEVKDPIKKRELAIVRNINRRVEEKNHNVANILPQETEEAYKAVESAVTAATLKFQATGEISEGFTHEADGRTKISDIKATDIAIEAIREPRIAKRIPDLLKEGLGPFYTNNQDKNLIDTALKNNPNATYLELRKMVDDRRDRENATTIDVAVKSLTNVPITSEDKHKLISIVNDYRNSKTDGLVDEKVYTSIKKTAVELKVYELIQKMNNNPHHFQYTFPEDKIKEIVTEVLDGADPQTAIDKRKVGANPTFGSTFWEMLKRIGGEITKPPSNS